MIEDNDIRVVELFAGVGGFRLGLERASERFKTIWANQWEPGKTAQHAFTCYTHHFGTGPNHVNQDIALVKNNIPEHDLLVGGFPCQDYSVARTGAQGMEGKKGVLWWSINDVIATHHPKYVLLENVDRLLKSPTKQRGRDFGVILRCLLDQGYAAEWRVINAADYGNAQRRRRTFIFAYRKDTALGKALANHIKEDADYALKDTILRDGFFAKAFPIEGDVADERKYTQTSVGPVEFPDLANVSDSFAAPLYSAGVMFDGKVLSFETTPVHEPSTPLGKIRVTDEVPARFFLNGALDKWEFLKGAKRIPRVKPNGEPYFFSEGPVRFPDALELPSRTMLTSEGSVNRSSHVINDAQTGRLRILTPVECERLNGFPDGWTDVPGVPEKFRYFAMGNALVVPLITRMGKRLLEAMESMTTGGGSFQRVTQPIACQLTLFEPDSTCDKTKKAN